TETAVDIAGEDTEEIVDDAGAAHGSLVPVLKRDGGHRRPAEEPVTALGPSGKAAGIIHGSLTKLLAAAQTLAERVGRRLKHRGRPGLRGFVLAGHFDHRGGNRDGDEYDCPQPGQQLAVHAAPLPSG